MATVKRFVCLANAHKDGERCLAGKELTSDGPANWIRPVSDQYKSGALSRAERVYLDGMNSREPELLDVLEIHVERPLPDGYQKENWLLTPSTNSKKVGRLAWADLEQFVDPAEELWVNGHDSLNRRNNRVPADFANTLNSSLMLIKVQRVTIDTDRADFNRTRKYGSFEHGRMGHPYKLPITDPAFEEKYAARTDKFSIGEAYLTVSLTGESKGYAYKLIAGIMEREQA